MNKQEYINKKQDISNQISNLKQLALDLREQYIKKCKPCDIDDLVEITTISGTKKTGVAKSFKIFLDDVFVDSLNIGKSKKIYFSKPYESIRIIEKAVND